MNDLFNAVKDYRSSLLMWYTQYLLFGIVLLLVCNYIFKPTAEMYPNWVNFSELQKNVSIVVVAYFFARFCNLLGGWIVGPLLFLLRRNYRSDIKQFYFDLKNLIRNESYILNKTSPINFVEFEEFVLKGKHAEYRMQKYDIEKLFMQILVGFFTILAVFHTYLWVALILVSFARLLRVSSGRKRYREEAMNYFYSHKKTVIKSK